MSLQRLLTTTPLEQFVAEHYHKLPYSRPSAAEHLCSLGTFDSLASMLADPQADVLVCRRNRRHEGPPPTTSAAARQRCAEGFTILVRHAERHDERLRQLAAGFAAELGGPVNVHVYATPPEQFGFGWHYDAEDVFIVQTTGTKEYSLRKNTVNPWPILESMPQDLKYEREIMPLLRCRLHPGDWLYIPAGYWHMGQALAATDAGASGEPSTNTDDVAISLAIGVLSPTALEVLDQLRQELLDSLRWRQRLPVTGPHGPSPGSDVEAQLDRLLEDLASDVQRQLRQPGFRKRLLQRLYQEALDTTGRESDADS